jgi:multiple antibiotic resistance protein
MEYQFLQSFLQNLLKATIALLIVVDPLGNVPIFISLTKHLTKEDRKRAFNIASIISFIIAVVFVIGGRQFLIYFGIDMYSFFIAGGLLLILLAIQILIGVRLIDVTESRDDVGAVPLAFPLLIGPGALTTLLVFNQTSGIIVTIFSVLIVMLITRIILQFIDSIYQILGRTGSIVVSRLMAVFIAAIGIQFMMEGIKQFFL